MKCVAIKGVKQVEVSDIDLPVSTNGSVVIDVKKSGICGSDIHYWDLGAPLNLVMGHEFCGTVVDSGDREDLKIGDRVTGLPISPCGKCEACTNGNPQYCPETWTYAVGLSLTNPGAYAEKTSVRSDLVIKVPDNITDNEAAMVEPTAVGLHAVNLADVKIGDKVLVVGAGIIGDICALLAKLNGASYVAVSETNINRAKKAVDLGCADEYFDAKDPDFLTKVRRECPFGYDIVFDCSGNSAAVTSALLNAKPNGTVVLVGVSVDSITIPSALIVMHELKVYGAIGYTVDEFKECVELMANKEINMTKFVDDIVGLNDVQKAFERLTSGTDSAVKILIDPKK